MVKVADRKEDRFAWFSPFTGFSFETRLLLYFDK